MDYLLQAIHTGATDLYVSASAAAMRIQGNFQRLQTPAPADFQAFVDGYLPAGFLGALSSADQNTAITAHGVRCRIHGYLARGCPQVAVRILSAAPPPFSELNLPDNVWSLLDRMDAGLTLIGGPTGVGKSTLLASWIQHQTNEIPCHVITFEDPVEWIYAPNQAAIDQREVGQDVASFEEGVLSALRADADVLVIGELRTPAAVDAAVLAAETGHSVIATVHGEDAVHVLSRLTAGRSESDRSWFLHRLASVLRGVVSLRLLRTSMTRSDQASARANVNIELLLVTAPVRHIIEQGAFRQLTTQLQTGRQFGMMTFEQHLETMRDVSIRV